MLMPPFIMRPLHFSRTHESSVALSRCSWQPWMKEVGELTCWRGLAVHVPVV
jgi:hypothetical protein